MHASINRARIKAAILDMDGVLWRGSEPIGDLPSIFADLERMKWNFILATNNSTSTPEQYVEKLAQYGVRIVSRQVVNSGVATASYLKERFPGGGAVYVVGESGLVDVLAEEGFYPAGNGVSHDEVLAVVASMDRWLTYEKLRQATLLIRSGCLFIGTNPDRTFPTPEGLVPGAGAILGLLELASGHSPIIIGKPEPQMYRVALHRLGTMPAETLVIGDRLETDIAGAQAIGCLTGLVLSGVTPEASARAWQPPPDWIAPDLENLLANFTDKVKDRWL